MRIYLDSKDIIQLFEKSEPCTVEEFDEFLRTGNHELVFSFITIIEISEPLFHKNAKTNVMRLLGQIEKLPHKYIHSSIITRLELEEAYRSFVSGEEYRGISLPFASRFDMIVDLEGNPATKQYFNYPLAEIIWDLFNSGGLSGLNKYANKLSVTFKADRALNPKPSLKNNFANTVDRNIKLYQLKIPQEEVTSFASWIYSNPKRCPSDRLGYKLWHKMIKNLTDTPLESDLEDFANIAALPYVDFMTLDRRMYGYVSQVSKDNSIEYNKKIFRNTEEILNKMRGH